MASTVVLSPLAAMGSAPPPRGWVLPSQGLMDDPAMLSPGQRRERRRVAVVHQGDPSSSSSWSGTPKGLLGGLREGGCEAVPINAEFPGAARIAGLMRMTWLDQATSRWYRAAASAAANRALRAAAPLDGVVMIGTGYELTCAAPVVTFEDMTVAQVLRFPDIAAEVDERAAMRWRKRQLAAYRHSRACCVASHWAAASVRDDYGIPEDKVHIVGLGSNAKVSLRTVRDWSVPRFLFIGVDWERKRGAAVVEAFAEVKARYPQATLDLVGGHPAIVADGVVGHGRLPLNSAEGQRMLAELLERTTCLVMPSKVEPYGIAYLDAAAAGVPSIGTTVGGAPDAVGDSGRVVDPQDQQVLVQAMLELAEPVTARELGERALARAPELTWVAVARRVLAALLPYPARACRVPPAPGR
jgi:glycogen synthase